MKNIFSRFLDTFSHKKFTEIIRQRKYQVKLIGEKLFEILIV